MEDSDTSHDAFMELAQKSLQAEVCQAAWCPSMDLLAVAFEGGRVAVHRLNWQRLWLVTLPSSPTAIVWTPDGEALTVGCQSGTVLLLASIDGSISLETSAIDSSAVSALVWAQEPATVPGVATGLGAALEGFHGRTTRFCHDPSSEALKAEDENRCCRITQTSIKRVYVGEQAAWSETATQPSPPARLALLGVAHCSGIVHICSSSLVVLAATTPPSSSLSVPCRHYQIAIHHRLQYLLALGTTNAGDQVLEVRSTAAIAQARLQLRFQTHLSSEVVTHCTGVKQAVEHAAEDWGEAVTEVESMLQRLTSLMVDHACSGSAISQLMRLMTAGTLPSSLETFLVQAPGERGLRSIARKIDTSINSAAAELLDYCIPCLNSIGAQLGDAAALPPSALLQLREANEGACSVRNTVKLRTLRAWEPNIRTGYQGVPVTEGILDGAETFWGHILVPVVKSRALEAARGLAAQLVLRCHQVRLALMDAAREYRRFFTWLLQCAHRVRVVGSSTEASPVDAQPVDCAAVVTFMARGLAIDDLGPELQAPATISNDGVGENSRPLPPLASKGCRLLQLCGLVMPATEATSLELLCQMLEQETTRAFAEVPKALSPAATPLVRVALDRTSSPQRQAGNRSHTHQVGATMCITPCPPQQQLAQPDDTGECFGWVAWPQTLPGGTTAADRRFVCLLRILLPPKAPTGADEALSMEVVAVEYPSGRGAEDIVDCTFFTGNSLAVLFAADGTAGGGGGSSGDVRLQLWSLAPLHFTAFPQQSQDATAATPLQVCLEKGAVVSSGALKCRQRRLQWKQAAAPLTVSWERGLCAVLSSDRIALLDLDLDDDGSDTDEGEDNGDSG